MKRVRLPNNKSRELFTRTAKNSHRRNSSPPPMRGGIRL